jgi:hypothetical protein
MGFAKKLKRKTKVGAARIEKKELTTAAKASREAEYIFKLNERRIRDMSRCRIMPAIAYVLRRKFKWGATLLNRLNRKYEEFVEQYIIAGYRDHRTYITIPWLQEGLRKECDFDYVIPNRIPAPTDARDARALVATKAGNYSIMAYEFIETVWLWVLHVDFGFGGKRIKECVEELRTIGPLNMPMKMLYHMMDEIESSKGRPGETIAFTGIRKTLKKLDIENDDFSHGLVMLQA